MEGGKLNLYAPLPSIRRISYSSEFKNKKKTITRQETTSFDHLTEPASVPFVWEHVPGKPKDEMSTLIQESGLLESDEDEEDSDTVSSNQSFSFNCSTNGEKSEDDSSRESLDLMMSRFLPAAKAMALTHTKHQSSSPYNSSEQKKRTALVIRQRSQLVQEQEHFDIVQSLYDDLNIDDDEDDDEDDDVHVHVDHRIYPNVTKKAACGFLPRLCARSSFKILNPVRLNSGLNRESKPNSGEQTGVPNWSTRRLSGFLGTPDRLSKHSGDQTNLPNWSTRRLSGFNSPYRTSYSETGFESCKRLSRGISKSQELYPTRTRRETLPNYSNSGEIKMYRNSISTPLRNQRTTVQDSRFLVEEVNRRKNRSGNLMSPSLEHRTMIALSPPPLPETPSRPWLQRTLLPPAKPRPYGVVLGQVGTKKPNKENVESMKWETIVKTSYVHNDHVRYSQELIVHPYT